VVKRGHAAARETRTHAQGRLPSIAQPSAPYGEEVLVLYARLVPAQHPPNTCPKPPHPRVPAQAIASIAACGRAP
jgi:hypothetical protein